MGGGRVGVVEAFGDGGASGSGPYRLFLFFFFLSFFLSVKGLAGRWAGGLATVFFFLFEPICSEHLFLFPLLLVRVGAPCYGRDGWGLGRGRWRW